MQAYTFKSFVHTSAERVKRKVMSELHTLRNFFQPDTFNGTDGVCKVFVNNFFAYSDSLKKLRGLIRLKRRNAHF